MRFSNQECLQKMLLAVRNGVAPAMPQSGNAAVALGVVMSGIEELLRRETLTPDFLERLMPEGLELCARQIELLEALDIPAARNLGEQRRVIAAFTAERTHVAALHKKYNDIVDLLDAGAQRLLESKPRADHKLRERISNLLQRAARWELALQEEQARPLPDLNLTAVPDSTLDAAALEAFIARQAGSDSSGKVENLQRLLGGYGKETWLFDWVTESGLQPLVLRRNNQSPGMLQISTWRMIQEFPLITRLYHEGALLPEPLWLGVDHPGLDRTFYIARRLPGKAMGTFMNTNADVSEGLWLQVAEQLARLHGIPIQRFSDHIAEFYGPQLVNCTAAQGMRHYIDSWYGLWKDFKRLSSPMEVYLFDWLYEHLPTDDRPATVVHSDFGPHNLLADGQRLTALLDWESPLFGSPGIDLAYVKRWVTETMDWQKFVDHYEASGGRHIEPAEYAFCNTLTYMRTVTGTNSATASLRYEQSTEYKELMLGLRFMPKMMSMAYGATQERS